MIQQPQQPIKEYRAGKVKAAIWKDEHEEQGRTVVRHNVKIQKRYRDQQTGDYKSTEYYYGAELADLILVAQQAFEFVRLRESEDDSDLPTVAA